ncbi:hypothetical protein KC946_00465 [Candidatus Saccharibacteria bacterium]|nr:hypothetical protein [Candidatus Saccharibacteria bacterium]
MKRFLLFLSFLLGIVFLLIIVVSITGNRSSSDNVISANKVFDVADYADRNSEVKTIVAGPIVGNDEYREVRISVTPNSRTIDIIQGYQGKVIKTQSFANNREAYTEFLDALSDQKFGISRDTKLSLSGSCATGKRYVYQTFDNSEIVSDVWSGSCTRGSSQGSTIQIQNLFRRQITDYYKFTAGLNL